MILLQKYLISIKKSYPNCLTFIFRIIHRNQSKLSAIVCVFRIPPGALSIDQEATDSTPQAVLTSSPVSDHEPIHSPTDASSLDQTPADKLALVALPPVSIEALAVVPLRKPRHPEHVQRRIRRPFSVAEVEALVQAVEKLGTGRFSFCRSHFLPNNLMIDCCRSSHFSHVHIHPIPQVA